MAELFQSVVPNTAPLTEAEFHSALCAGLARVAANIGRGNLADKTGRTTRSLDKLFSGSSGDTSGKGLLDFLKADPTALTAEHTQALRDGRRDHRETIRIADKARPVVAKYQGIIAEADRFKGVGQ